MRKITAADECSENFTSVRSTRYYSRYKGYRYPNAMNAIMHCKINGAMHSLVGDKKQDGRARRQLSSIWLHNENHILANSIYHKHVQ